MIIASIAQDRTVFSVKNNIFWMKVEDTAYLTSVMRSIRKLENVKSVGITLNLPKLDIARASFV